MIVVTVGFASQPLMGNDCVLRVLCALGWLVVVSKSKVVLYNCLCWTAFASSTPNMLLALCRHPAQHFSFAIILLL